MANLFKSFIEKLSSSNKKKNEFELIGNTFGFLGLKEGIGVSSLCIELAKASSEQGLHTCIVDCNPLSTFYLSKAMMLNADLATTEIPSIESRLRNRNSELKDSLIQITPKLHVLCFGMMPYQNTFDIDADIIKLTYEEVKDTFDLVIMDIPNLPWVETMLHGLDICNSVYCVSDFTADAVFKYIKLKNFLDLAGMKEKINTVVVGKNPIGKSIAKDLSVNTGAQVIAEIPLIPNYSELSLGRFSVVESLSGKESKLYESSLNFILREMINGINSNGEEGE